MKDFLSGLMLVMGTYFLGLGVGVVICSPDQGNRWWCGIALCIVGCLLELSLIVMINLFDGVKEKKEVKQ